MRLLPRFTLLLLLSSLAAPGLASADDPADAIAGPQADRAFAVTAGIGLVSASSNGDSEVRGEGQGVYAAVEYAFRATSWFSPRLYSGAIVAPARGRCDPGVSPCEVSATFAFAGGKVRLLAPIPWVAPFVELGLGGSLGRFTTRVGDVWDRQTTGFAYHYPVALGLALGPKRAVELSFQYLYHPAQRQVSGGVAAGIRF